MGLPVKMNDRKKYKNEQTYNNMSQNGDASDLGY